MSDSWKWIMTSSNRGICWKTQKNRVHTSFKTQQNHVVAFKSSSEAAFLINSWNFSQPKTNVFTLALLLNRPVRSYNKRVHTAEMSHEICWKRKQL